MRENTKERKEKTRKEKNLKKEQISYKLLKLMAIAIMSIVICTSVISMAFFHNTVKRTLNVLIENATKIAADNVRTTVEARLETIEEFASRAYFGADYMELLDTIKYCQEFSQRQGYLSTLYVDRNGITSDGTNISDSDYFKKCMETGQSVISEPELYEKTNSMVVSLLAPVIRDDTIQGAVIAQADAGFLSELTNAIEIGESGNSYMLGEDGTAIAHYDNELVLKSYNIIAESKNNKGLEALATVQEHMVAGEESVAYYKYQGTEKIIGYSPIGINGWSIGVTANTIEFLSTVYIAIAVLVVIIIICIIFSVLSVAKNIHKMIKPLVKCSDRIILLAEGDLKTEFPSIESHDEIGMMGEAAKNMMEKLRTMIWDVNHLLDGMAGGNFNVKTEAEDSYVGDFQGILQAMRRLNDTMSNALAEIELASDQVSIGSTQMAENAQSLAEGATEQAGAVEELTAAITNAASVAVESAKTAGQSYIQAEEYTKQAESSNENMKQLGQAMEKINETAKEIGNIIAEIEDIASQTNLLSLNASIEAARAGEAGKGFAVVADQIGKLAADSAKSAINTRKLIQKSIDEVDAGNEITQRTFEVLSGVITGIKTIADSSREISEMSKGQAESMQQIELGVGQISEVVQNNSASAEETSATSEELSAQAVGLKELVNKFELKKK